MTAAAPTTTTHEIHAYATAVRAALDDLPPSVCDELLEDLEGHLAEVASEIDGTLVDRLGEPTAYAEELRRSADLPPRTPPGTSRQTSALGRAVRAAVDARVEHAKSVVERTPGGSQTLVFLPQLRPAWWVARGWLLVLAVSVMTGGLLSSFPVPQLLGSAVVGAAASIAAIAISVRAGGGGRPAGPRARRLVVAANVVAVVAALGVASEARDRVRYTGYETAYAPAAQPTTLTAPYGPISNIYAFDALGNPLSGVQLFDQHGNPLDILLRQSLDGRYAEPVQVFGADGRPRGNVFPREYRIEDQDPVTGRPAVVQAPHATFTAGPLAPSAAPTSTSTSSPSASAAAQASAAPSPTPSPTPSPSPAAAPAPTPAATPSR